MRNITIDILKFIGLALIILAHTSVAETNPVIMQLRNFDVPLMVLLSGILVTTSYKENSGYITYLKKRITRLLVPTYIFLTVFFVGIFILFTTNFPFGIKTIIASYFLSGGIGYVWIIKVYLLAAAVVPFMVKFKNKQGNKKYFLTLIGIYCMYETLYWLGIDNILFTQIICYLIPYATIMGIGIGIKDLSKRTINTIITSSLIIFGVLAIILWWQNGELVSTQSAKYPATLYYLSYALGISLLLYKIIDKNDIQQILDCKFVRFVSTSSMWIYLWHIPFVYFLKYIPIEIHWAIEYITIFTAAIMIVYMQNKTLNLLPRQVTKYTFFKYLRG